MARIGIINGCFGRGNVQVRAALTAAQHTVEELEWQDDFYAAPLGFTGFDLYVLIRSGGLSLADKGSLREVIKSGRRVLLLYTLRKPAFQAEGFASVSLE